uniref:NADH dehydrogenase subunit 4L n=1 Tax=Skeletonema pseudocostatum TaxID=41457 RepID=UPI001D1182AC|nr:NADH dehydrogenase subunit 4L [Skeletonema pseudocostatum]YP_010208960.1 NADH dehydrogenase subunit 4L [Skeletonema tropicum]UBA16156.1 NADH dehydrogenase subunit 4L [Skeletonema pseudocostatum]UBA16270.1 NADH dehydrogenase subunit 4L [Skeletonema tropicum]
MYPYLNTVYMIILNLNYILNIVIALFLIGVLGLVLNRKNILITLMSIELMLLAINLNFVLFSIYLDDITGYVFVLFILTIAAAESAIGLAILTIYYRLKNTIRMDKIKNVKG